MDAVLVDEERAPRPDPKPTAVWAVVVLTEHGTRIWPEGLILQREAIRMSGPIAMEVLNRWSAWRAATDGPPRVAHHLARLLPITLDDAQDAWLVDQLGRLR